MNVFFVSIALLAVVAAHPKIKDKQEVKSIIPQGNEVAGSRILNGYDVSPHEIPYQVRILIKFMGTTSTGACGGSLITRRYVLTAGHCVYRVASAEVYLGTYDISVEESSRIVIPAKRLILHPDFFIDTVVGNDLGLIELEYEVELNEYIDLVKLPRRKDLHESFEDANVRISGWGMTIGDGFKSNVLLAVNSTVMSNSDCKSFFTTLRDNEICTSGRGGVGACNEDSGGPLIAGDVQIGIVSFGKVGCVYGYPTVFARVTSFLDWIEENSDYVIKD